MDGNQRDTFPLGDSIGAQIARRVATSDELPVVGRYHVTAFKARPERVAEYLECRVREKRLRDWADRVMRVPFMFWLALALMERAEAWATRALACCYTEWEEDFPNIVVTVGRNDMLDKYLAGSSYSATFHVGLKGTGTPVAGDTMASHASWNEVGGTNAPAYTGNRPAPSWAAATGGAKSTSAAMSFVMNASGTVDGAFMVAAGSATKDNTTGILFSVGTFSGGARSVDNTTTLNVTYTLTTT